MRTYTNSIIINAPIDIVFKYISDDELIKKWNTSVIRNEYYHEEDKENIIIGMKYKQFLKIVREVVEFEVTILEYDPPNKIAGDAKSSKYGSQKISYELTAIDETTKLTIITIISNDSYFNKLLDFCFGWVQNIALKNMMTKIKNVIEKNSLIY